TKAAIHLSHGGRMAGKVYKGQSATSARQIPVAPSAIADELPGCVVPRELTIGEIEEIEDNFAEAAWRAKEVGFEVIVLHGAHVYLINQFLSPLSNKRQDAYGGDFNRRLRFLLEIIRKIKQKVGDNFPLMCSLNGAEIVEGGLTIEDARQIAWRLERAGLYGIRISLSPLPFNFTQYDYFPPSPIPPMRSPRGQLVHLAAAVKDVVSIPVMVAGRIITPRLAEQILEQDKADLIGLGRGLIADPEWPKKSQGGREREIRHCISCMFCSKVARIHTAPGACAINPRYAREGESKITPANKSKNVFIAGCGPAGLEAGRVAALRGHKVTLYEKDKIGGQLNLACIPPGKDEIRLLLDFEQVQLEILGAKIKNEELTLETVKREKPEAVVIATGAIPMQPDFPGSRNKNVVTAWQVLGGEYIPKGKIVVLGGRQIGAETAEYLASKGDEVTIVETSANIARDFPSPPIRDFLLLSLRFLGVNILTNTTVEEITKIGVTMNRKGQRFSIEADTVVLALGNKPNRELASQLEKLSIELHTVGDCAGVGKIIKAIRSGFHAGLAL
ncbi:FAD-dependent oxidoreductase, partial [Thermodesulfobacteriota bacterium]